MTMASQSRRSLIQKVASSWDQRLAPGSWVFVTYGPVTSRGRWQVQQLQHSPTGQLDRVLISRGGVEAILWRTPQDDTWYIRMWGSDPGSVQIRQASMSRTAGEVRFVKDQSESKGWAYGGNPPPRREGVSSFQYNARKAKMLARVLRGTMLAMGHTMSVYSAFAKLKSSEISPDGALGGKGYIQNIKDMRFAYSNAIEALSSLADTLYDEVRAPHWTPLLRAQPEAQEVMKDVEKIKQDPEGFAEKEVAQDFSDRA